MDLDIRKAVIANLNNSTYDDVRLTLTNAFNSDSETILPGLGVIFELYWKNCSEEEKDTVVNKITKCVN